MGIVRLTGEDAIRLLTLDTALMRTSVSLYHRHRFPAEIISHCHLRPGVVNYQLTIVGFIL